MPMDNIELISSNIYNKETFYEDSSVLTDEGLYIHVNVQVLENTYTGKQSIGWYATPETELLTDEEAEAEWPI